MRLLTAYKLRHERRLRLVRAMRKRMEMTAVKDRTEIIARQDILLFCVLRNERVRLPYFLRYYRNLGVTHFLFVDNGSTDGSEEFLAEQPDVSLWHSDAEYRRARFGMDWLNFLLNRYGAGHWCVTVDADEFLLFAHADRRKLPELTHYLDARRVRAFGTLLLDMYSRQPIEKTNYVEGANPFRRLNHFDSGNYIVRRNPTYENLWIQGGPRQRLFFADDPDQAPALNKIPLVRWRRGYCYISSTHALLPRRLNRVYDAMGGEMASGCLLHAKFLNILRDKTAEEMSRRQHYAAGREYRAYGRTLERGNTLWTPASTRFEDWRQLQDLGLMSAGGWI